MAASVVMRMGTLTGMGRVCACEVLARVRKPYIAGQYTEALIISAPADLPDGSYHVTFDGFEMLCDRVLGTWGLGLTHPRGTEPVYDTAMSLPDGLAVMLGLKPEDEFRGLPDACRKAPAGKNKPFPGNLDS